MAIYEFIRIGKQDFTQADVKKIIKTAGFNPSQFTYRPRVDNDGYKVTGPDMSTSKLRNAARSLDMKVEISSAAALSRTTSDVGTTYTIQFKMDSATIDSLQGSSLVAFKGVSLGNGTNANGAAPVAWFTSTEFGPLTTLTWTEDYSAYVSQSSIVPNGTIEASNSVDISLSEMANVDGQLDMTVEEGGEAGCISINNKSNSPFVCGISMAVNGGAAQPICAFPLHGNHTDVFIPEERVYLMFVGTTIDTGTVYEQSVGSGLLVDLTSSPTRTGIKYDIDAGWTWGEAPWANQYPPATNLVPLLLDGTVQNKVTSPQRLTVAA